MTLPGTLARRNRNARRHNQRSAARHHERQRVPSAPRGVLVVVTSRGTFPEVLIRVVSAPGSKFRVMAPNGPPSGQFAAPHASPPPSRSSVSDLTCSHGTDFEVPASRSFTLRSSSAAHAAAKMSAAQHGVYLYILRVGSPMALPQPLQLTIPLQRPRAKSRRGLLGLPGFSTSAA